MKHLIMGLLALMVLPLVHAHAAKMEVDHDPCHEAQCKRIIGIYGKIESGDADHFKRLIKSEKIERGVVFLYSPGGVLDDALAIGAIIHELNWVTFVGDDGTCASACADIWLAGMVRYVSKTAEIGFHRASRHDIKTGKYLGLSKSGDDKQRAYYRRLGLTEAAIRHLLSAKPDDMTWLDGETAAELGIIATTIEPQKKEEEKTSKTEGRCQDESGNEIVCNGERHADKSVKTQKCDASMNCSGLN